MPGPTMTTGVWWVGGSLKLEDLRKTGTLVPEVERESHVEHTP